jgi:hypothetical protein
VLFYEFAVDGFGQNPGAGGFAYAAGAAKQKGLGQVLRANGILQRGGDVLLPHHASERDWAVFTGRNDEIFHTTSHKGTLKSPGLEGL